jgi:nucleotide-binding universal stress UspA family protein
MGMQGMSFAEHLLVGSVTASVLQQADFPVLVVPMGARFHPLRNIIFACEYHYLSGHNMLVPLRELALTFGAEVQVLHIESPVEDEVLIQSRVDTGHHLEKVLKAVKHRYNFVKGGDISKGIEQELQKNKAEMLVMVPRKQDLWDRIFSKSTTRKIAFLTNIPLLSLPNPK